MVDKTLTIVFGDTRLDRLQPLLSHRVKAALPFGGEYRVIDFVLTNCLHSGLRRILVLASGPSHSLFAHLRNGWSVFNPALGEYITPFPTPIGPRRQLSEGLTALRASLPQLESSGAREVVLLVGGHVYRMDYAAMLSAHREGGAAITVATIAGASAARSTRPSVTTTGERVTGVHHDRSPRRQSSVARETDPSDSRVPRLMGVYVFSADLLIQALHALGDDVSRQDFAEDFLGSLVAQHDVRAYRFGGTAGRVSRDQFWAQLGTLDHYFEANLALLEPLPTIDLYQEDWAIWSYSGPNPPARTVQSPSGNEGLFVNSVVSNGTVVAGGAVSRSVLARRVRVDDNAVVERAVLLDDVHVGEGSELRNCIVDKGARLPPGTRIGLDPREDARRFTVTPGGVVVVPRGYDGAAGEAPS